MTSGYDVTVSMTKTLYRVFEELELPEHMRSSTFRYLLDGIEPGNFLTCVFTNDLRGAAGRADHYNLKALPEWAKFSFSCPVGAYDVGQWCKNGGLGGVMKVSKEEQQRLIEYTNMDCPEDFDFTVEEEAEA